MSENEQKTQAERRSRRRAKITAKVFISTVTLGGPFTEIGTSVDMSRDGLLFLSRYRGYEVGQFVKIIFPYSGPAADPQYQGARVVRVQPRPDDTVAVAVKFDARPGPAR